MLSDEEKKAIDNMKSLLLYSKEHEYFSPFQEQEIDDMNIVLNIVEKQSKEIEELRETLKCTQNSWYEDTKVIEKQSKEIELLKEENEKYKNPPFFDEDNYISKEKSEQKEKEAYIDGTNIADELCNKKWEDKIKAKIEEVHYKMIAHPDVRMAVELALESLLEKG